MYMQDSEDKSIKVLEKHTAVTVDLPTKSGENMAFDVCFVKVPEEDTFRFYIDLTREEFGKYLKAMDLHQYTDARVLKNRLFPIAFSKLKLSTDDELKDLSKWAGAVADKVCIIKEDLTDNGFKATEVEVGPDHKITVTPCSQGFEMKNFDDIEWFLTSDFLVDGGDCIYELAADILNYKNLEKNQEAEEDKLQEFYEEEIADFYNHKSQNEWTKEENEAFGYFSDWHKDVYGHRPHPGQNECQKIINEEFEYYNGRYSGEIDEEEDFEK